MMSDISQNDLIREDIENKMGDRYDFSKQSYKKKAVEEFLENHPELNSNFSKMTKVYYPILKQYAKKEGISIASNKKQLIKSSAVSADKDMDVTINPVPQVQENLIPNPVNPLDNPTQTMQPVIQIQHDLEGVKASINAFYLIVKTVFAPEAELLSDDEKKSLGSIWLPIFNKYLQNEKSILLVAVASSLGIVAPKLSKGRKLKKKKNVIKKKEEQKTELEEFNIQNKMS